LDLVRAILVLAPTRGFDVFNVAGDQEIQILDFVNIARSLSSSEIFPPEPEDQGNFGHTHILRGSASIAKLVNLGWTPKISIEEAILRTIRSRNWRISNNYMN
jgi:nucleoside-diphosphate-sugar epimerase